MTECPAFLFIFLAGSISEQRGPGGSPSRARREPDLSRPPDRSEHLQNRRAYAAPTLIKPTIHLPAGRGDGEQAGAGWGAAGRQTHRVLEFRETTLRHSNHCGPRGLEKEKEPAASAARGPARLLARPSRARPGSRPEIAFGRSNIKASSTTPPHRPSAREPPRPPPARRCREPPQASVRLGSDPGGGTLTTMIICDIISVTIISTPHLR